MEANETDPLSEEEQENEGEITTEQESTLNELLGNIDKLSSINALLGNIEEKDDEGHTLTEEEVKLETDLKAKL